MAVNRLRRDGRQSARRPAHGEARRRLDHQHHLDRCDQAPAPGVMIYRAAKAAVVQVSKSLAIDLAEHGIRVNCIAPGHIPTGMTTYDMTEVIRLHQPLQRQGMPIDVAYAALFLASDRSRRSRGWCCRSTGGRPSATPSACPEGARPPRGQGDGAVTIGRSARPRGGTHGSGEAHLLLRRSPGSAGGAAQPVAVASAARPGRARAARRRARRQARLGVRGPGARQQRSRCEQGAAEEALRDRARGHRGRRLPLRHSQAASRGHGPRQPVGLGDLRAARDRSADPRPRAAERLLCGVERLGRRGVQRGGPRSPVRARVPARPLARGRRGRARALRGDRPPRRDHRRLRDRPRRPRLGPAVGRRGADRPADQLPPQGRHVVEVAPDPADRQVALRRVRLGPAHAARRAAGAHDVLRRARAAPRSRAGARRGGHRLAALLHPSPRP